LTERDKRANDVWHLLSLASPRTDCPATLPQPVTPPAAAKPSVTPESRAADDLEPLPQSGNLPGFLSILHKAEHALSSGAADERAAIVQQFESIQTKGQARAYVASVLQKLEAAKAGPT
jgi:phospholipase C